MTSAQLPAAMRHGGVERGDRGVKGETGGEVSEYLFTSVKMMWFTQYIVLKTKLTLEIK